MTRTGSASGPCSLSLRTASRAAVRVLMGPIRRHVDDSRTGRLTRIAAPTPHTHRRTFHKSWREATLAIRQSQSRGFFHAEPSRSSLAGHHEWSRRDHASPVKVSCVKEAATEGSIVATLRWTGYRVSPLGQAGSYYRLSLSVGRPRRTPAGRMELRPVRPRLRRGGGQRHVRRTTLCGKTRRAGCGARRSVMPSWS